MKDETKP